MASAGRGVDVGPVGGGGVGQRCVASPVLGCGVGVDDPGKRALERVAGRGGQPPGFHQRLSLVGVGFCGSSAKGKRCPKLGVGCTDGCARRWLNSPRRAPAMWMSNPSNAAWPSSAALHPTCRKVRKEPAALRLTRAENVIEVFGRSQVAAEVAHREQASASDRATRVRGRSGHRSDLPRSRHRAPPWSRRRNATTNGGWFPGRHRSRRERGGGHLGRRRRESGSAGGCRAVLCAGR